MLRRRTIELRVPFLEIVRALEHFSVLCRLPRLDHVRRRTLHRKPRSRRTDTLLRNTNDNREATFS
jgi:hypothetical protein